MYLVITHNPYFIILLQKQGLGHNSDIRNPDIIDSNKSQPRQFNLDYNTKDIYILY